jgi:hypothetical protein
MTLKRENKTKQTNTHKSQRVYKDKRIRNISKKERKTHVMCQAWLFLFCFGLNGLYEEILFFVFTYKQNKKKNLEEEEGRGLSVSRSFQMSKR